MINKLTNSSAADDRICSCLLLLCSVVVAGMEGRYLWSAVIGGGRGELFLAIAGDVGCGCCRLGGGDADLSATVGRICHFFLCYCMGVRRGGSDGFGGVPLSTPSLARDDLGCHGHCTSR